MFLTPQPRDGGRKIFIQTNKYMKNILYIYILSCYDDLPLDREWHFYSSLTSHNITYYYAFHRPCNHAFR